MNLTNKSAIYIDSKVHEQLKKIAEEKNQRFHRYVSNLLKELLEEKFDGKE
jgi:hypothetical protein